MSLEYYTCTGNVLPIGLAVCSFCREKHLKSVDLSNSKIITIANPVTLQNGPGPVNLKGIYIYIRSALNQVYSSGLQAKNLVHIMEIYSI